MTTLHTLLALAALYLAFAVGYQLLFATIALLPAPRPVRRDERERKFVLFIDAFRADASLIETVRRSLRLRYPRSAYQVVVLAEELRPYTLAQLSDYPVELVETRFSGSSEVVRLQAGLEAVSESNYDAVVLVRADHHLAPDFLQHANAYLSAGFRAVQGKLAPLPGQRPDRYRPEDLIGSVDQQLDGVGRHALGHSARLLGSGMVFARDALRGALAQVPASAKLSVALDLAMARTQEPVAFATEATVYGNQAVARRQASVFLLGRSLAAWVKSGGLSLAHQVLHAACPPRMLTPGLLLVLTSACVVLDLRLAAVFALLFLINLGSLALAVPVGTWTEVSWAALRQLLRLPKSAPAPVFRTEASLLTPQPEAQLSKAR